MERALHILILEDEPADAELIEQELRKVRLTFTAQRVETREAFLRALREVNPDVILADYSLPSFDGLSALAMARDQCPEVPFIFVSGTIGEELAIETLTRGATDYVLKHRLAKLGPVVRRALQALEDQRARQRVERLKGELLEVFSHELRTPLSVIQEGISQLADGMLGSVTPDQAECLTTTSDGLKRLARLFEKALLATQVMTCRFEYQAQSISVATILKELQDECCTQPESKGVALQIDAGTPTALCFGDSRLLTAALRELVENAVHASPKGGTVTVACTPRSDGVNFTIRDTGPGIRKEDLPTLFERFHWLGDTDNRKTGGLGLGLFIAKSVIEGHGGSVAIESSSGQGTEVRAFLPVRQRQVLIVEDEATDAELLQREVIKHTTCEAITVSSGEQAVDFVQRYRPALVLLDIQMPGMDGLTALKRIKAVAPELPVAMVSGVWRDAEAREALASGAYDYVTKPVDLEYLKRVLTVKLM